jgi:hypothetical protein
MTSHYGVYRDERHPIAVRIWGHRLRTGQHWMEYMLEFLSVLSGFKYRFGQGLPGHDGQEGYLERYQVPTRLGLRRFVFYDERERTRDSRDTRAVAELRAGLRHYMPLASSRDEDVIDQVRSLLRSFSAIEEERSWYAKSLFPVHEQFLLWEGQRKGSTLKEYALPADQLELHQLDQGIEFSTRNFFARGGELYYLIVSAGTEHDHAKRERIASKLKQLLTQHNQSLGKIAEVIDATWSQLSNNGASAIDGTVGWILDPECALYQQIADDLDTFLDNDLDSLECLELLAHLIGFHIVTYIYHRAHPASDPEGHASGSCLEACRPQLLVDMLGEQESGVVRDQSAALFREQDDLQLHQARELIEQKIREWAGEQPDSQQLGAHLVAEVESYFQIGQTKTKGKYRSLLARINQRFEAGELGRDGLIQRYGEAIFETLSSEFRKNFLGVHRKIGRAIGLVAPRKGTAIRFVLGDTLLKTLVLATLARGEAGVMPFGHFLDLLFQRYGLIVGPGEANKSGLAARLRINEEYYTRNREAMLGRMRRAGLLTQYSDATALVRRR